MFHSNPEPFFFAAHRQPFYDGTYELFPELPRWTIKKTENTKQRKQIGMFFSLKVFVKYLSSKKSPE